MAQNTNDPRVQAYYRKQREQAEASAAQGNQQGARMASQIYGKREADDVRQNKYATDDATQSARYGAQAMAPGMAGKALGAGVEMAANPASAMPGGGMDVGAAIQHVVPQVAQVLGKLGLAGSARMVMQEAQQVMQRGRAPMAGAAEAKGIGAGAQRGMAQGAGQGTIRELPGAAPMKNVTPKKVASGMGKTAAKAAGKAKPAAKKAAGAPVRSAKAPSGRMAKTDTPKGRVDRLKDVPRTASAGKKTVGRGAKQAPYTERIKKMTTTKNAPKEKQGAPGKPMEGKKLHASASSVKPRRAITLKPGAKAKTRVSEKSTPANATMRGSVKATTRTTSGPKSRTSLRIERKPQSTVQVRAGMAKRVPVKKTRSKKK